MEISTFEALLVNYYEAFSLLTKIIVSVLFLERKALFWVQGRR